MFRPIGEVFEDRGVSLKVVEVDNCFCDGCYYQHKGLCKNAFAIATPDKILGSCSKSKRDDNKNVIFKEV